MTALKHRALRIDMLADNLAWKSCSGHLIHGPSGFRGLRRGRGCQQGLHLRSSKGMDAAVSIEHLAALLASPPRTRILEILLDGQPRSATELGTISCVAFSTASTHLAKLVDAGLVTLERSGRHRSYRVAGPHVVDVMEALYEHLPGQERQRNRPLSEIEVARTCYDHLAGRLGSSMTQAMVSQGYLRSQGKNFLLSEHGRAFFSGIGIDLEVVKRQRRMFARRCLDWTDKRDHLGGALGAALARHCFMMGWVQPGSRPRLVHATTLGTKVFQEHFGSALT